MYLSDCQTSSKATYLAGCYEDRWLQSAPSSLKARVGLFVCRDKMLVVKSYAHAHPLIRATVCRILLNREIKALERLQGVPGVPEFYGRHGKYGLAMAAINGRHPDKRDPGSWVGIDRQLTEFVSLIHQRGVTHNDLRLRNLMIDTPGQITSHRLRSGAFQAKGEGAFVSSRQVPFFQTGIDRQGKSASFALAICSRARSSGCRRIAVVAAR